MRVSSSSRAYVLIRIRRERLAGSADIRSYAYVYGQTSINIVILRTGIPDYGIVGICKDTSNDYNVPGLLIEHIENNKYNIKLFLSISVLSNDSIAMLNLQ